jgi:hypothetical protein
MEIAMQTAQTGKAVVRSTAGHLGIFAAKIGVAAALGWVIGTTIRKLSE